MLVYKRVHTYRQWDPCQRSVTGLERPPALCTGTRRTRTSYELHDELSMQRLKNELKVIWPKRGNIAVFGWRI
jgi:hypothetical protein